MYTVYMYTVYMYTVYLSTQGRGRRGGGELSQREGERGNSSQTGVENTNMTDLISSLWTLIKTCRKVPLQEKFLDDDILLCLHIVNKFMELGIKTFPIRNTGHSMSL